MVDYVYYGRGGRANIGLGDEVRTIIEKVAAAVWTSSLSFGRWPMTTRSGRMSVSLVIFI